MSDPPFDVIVIGAGLTGATLTLALASGGLRVALVDAEALETRIAPAFDGRASAVAYANLRQWRALGVAEALRPHAQPIWGIVAAEGSGAGASARHASPAALQFDAHDLGAAEDRAPDQPLGWMVENRHLRAALNAALIRSGVEVFAPAEIQAITVEGPLAEVVLRDARRLRAALVAGADGRDSPVRQAAGIGVSGWEYRQSGVVATVALAAPHEGVAHQVFLPGGPLAVLPLTGDRASLVWSERRPRAEALAQASPQAFEAYLARRFGEHACGPGEGRKSLERASLVGPRFVYPLRLQVADAMVAARTALVGDAAHVVHPIAGQGLNLGLKDAAALAEVLVEAHRLGEDLGGEVVLGRYARWRRFDAAGLAVATDLFARLFSNDDPVLRRLRGAALAVVDRTPWAKRLLMREAGADLGDLPRLLRGEAL